MNPPEQDRYGYRMRSLDLIELQGLEVFAHHGVFAHERVDGQIFVIDVTLELDLAAAADTDDLGATVNYGALAERVAEAARSTQFALIEALAGHLCQVVLAFAQVNAVTVRVAKPQAPIDESLGTVAVAMRRERGEG